MSTQPRSTTDGLIVIVARNNRHLTQKAVTSALAQDHPCNVWVIDNASTDGTYDWLRARAINEPRLHWWTYMKQRSLSACWNDGLQRAFAIGYACVLVLNNDVAIRPDCYRHLAEWPFNHNAHFTTAVSVGSKLELRIDDPPKTSSPHPDFSCFMIDRHCFELVGDFNESYFPAYCEDNDYHVRMHRAGIEAVSIDLPFVHYAAGTIKHADPAEQAEIRRGADANREAFKAAYGCYPSDTKAYNALFAKPIKRAIIK